MQRGETLLRARRQARTRAQRSSLLPACGRSARLVALAAGLLIAPPAADSAHGSQPAGADSKPAPAPSAVTESALMPSAASALAARVQQRYDATATLSGRFVQEVALGASGRTLRTEGTMRFRKPGEMRWEYEGAEPQTLIADGETLWIHQPLDQQVLRAPLAQAFESTTPVSFLFGVARLERDFEPRLLAPADDGSLRLALKAREQDDAVGGLVLEVDPETADLRAAVVTDVLGNATRVELHEVERNQVLEDALFRFVRPPGTDLLEAPGSAAGR